MFWTGYNKRFQQYFKRHNWTNRKIAFVAILIAVSVVFVLVMTTIMPFLIWPSLRLSVGGLPIKLTGYIFGPVIGGITGLLSDSITFAFRPTYWHYSYLLAFMVTGIIPGVVGYIMNRRWRKTSDDKTKVNILDQDKIDYWNLGFTVLLLVAIIIAFTTLIVYEGHVIFDEARQSKLAETEKPLINNKWVFLGIAISGISSMLVGIVIMVFVLKRRTFNSVIPIVAFSALLEIAVTPLVTLGDVSTLQASNNSSGFITVMTTHFLTAPVKIWINLAVIYAAWRIINPLISNRFSNAW